MPNIFTDISEGSSTFFSLAHLLISAEKYLHSPEGQKILADAKEFVGEGEALIEAAVNLAHEGTAAVQEVKAAETK